MLRLRHPLLAGLGLLAASLAPPGQAAPAVAVEKHEIVLSPAPRIPHDRLSAQHPFTLWVTTADQRCRLHLALAQIQGSHSLAGSLLGGVCQGQPVRKGLAAASMTPGEADHQLDPTVVVIVLDAPSKPPAQEVIQVEVCSDEDS